MHGQNEPPSLIIVVFVYYYSSLKRYSTFSLWVFISQSICCPQA